MQKKGIQEDIELMQKARERKLAKDAKQKEIEMLEVQFFFFTGESLTVRPQAIAKSGREKAVRLAAEKEKKLDGEKSAKKKDAKKPTKSSDAKTSPTSSVDAKRTRPSKLAAEAVIADFVDVDFDVAPPKKASASRSSSGRTKVCTDPPRTSGKHRSGAKSKRVCGLCYSSPCSCTCDECSACPCTCNCTICGEYPCLCDEYCMYCYHNPCSCVCSACRKGVCICKHAKSSEPVRGSVELDDGDIEEEAEEDAEETGEDEADLGEEGEESEREEEEEGAGDEGAAECGDFEAEAEATFADDDDDGDNDVAD